MRSECRGDVGHHGSILCAPLAVIRLGNLKLVLVGMAIEGGCNGCFIALDDRVEVVGTVLEGVARARRHVPVARPVRLQFQRRQAPSPASLTVLFASSSRTARSSPCSRDLCSKR